MSLDEIEKMKNKILACHEIITKQQLFIDFDDKENTINKQILFDDPKKLHIDSSQVSIVKLNTNQFDKIKSKDNKSIELKGNI